MFEERAGLSFSCVLCFVEADGFAGNVDFQGVVGGLCLGDVVGVDNARSVGHSNGEGFDVGDAFIKGAVGLGVADCLVEEIRIMIEERVLLLNCERKDSVKKSGDVEKIVFADFLTTVAINNEQADVAQGLAWVAQAWHVSAFDNTPQSETECGAAFFSFKIVLSEIAAVGATAVAFGQGSEATEPAGNRGAESFLSAE